MNAKDFKPFDFSTVKRDQKNSVASVADLTVEFSHIPARYASEFPNRQVVFKDVQIFETARGVTFSANYVPDRGSHWEFMINTPTSPGFHTIGAQGSAYAGLRHGGHEMHLFDYDTVELKAYMPDSIYQARLVNAGQAGEDGFQLSLASNVQED
ncbi:hypothetical protein IFT80_18685 [Pseudomonas sp. CFBP 8771]|uniref:hypothetical protein n=1 Tax=Pseudomonas sp. CFBP 8771 TaxID=2775285 RepID=UPI000F01639F|nr:hypothetical protein [Pseudomonas sp. CFBP 8771]MBD8604670.1 hypothetical protein [Pseudomonas sp. CFBP 8771]